MSFAPPMPDFQSALDAVSVPEWISVGDATVFVENGGTPRSGKGREKCKLKISQDKFYIHLFRTTRRSRSDSSQRTTDDDDDETSINQQNPKLNKPLSIDIACIERAQRGPGGMTISSRNSSRTSVHGKIRGKVIQACKTSAIKVSSPVRRRRRKISGSSMRQSSTGSDDSSYTTSSTLTSSIILPFASILAPSEAEIDDIGYVYSLSIFHDSEKCTTIYFDDEKKCDDMQQFIVHLLKEYKLYKSKRASKEVLLVRYYWRDIDKDHSDTMDEMELLQLMTKIGMNHKTTTSHREKMKLLLMKASSLGKKKARSGYSFEEAVSVVYHMQQMSRSKRKDNFRAHPIDKLWEEFFGSDCDVVSANDYFAIFIQKIQRDHKTTTKTVATVCELFAALNAKQFPTFDCHEKVIKEHQHYLDKARFESFLFSEENDAFDPTMLCTSLTDTNRPLSEYWINSSHNTYLTGNQFASESSSYMYTKALMRGCRCLEIDVWDGQVNSIKTPIVYHGRTATTIITFAEVVEAIREFLDGLEEGEGSYPIILSIENHCSLKNQNKMAFLLEDILGHYLYIPSKSDTRNYQPLPTPKDLVNKVVLKSAARPCKEGEDVTNSIMYKEEFINGDDNSIFLSDDELQNGACVKLEISSEVTSNCRGEACRNTEASIDAASAVDVSTAFDDLLLLHSRKFEDWEESIQMPRHHMHSFNESTLKRFGSGEVETKERLRRYNRDHMTRVYPHGTSVNSENFNPVTAWALGCQLVALNFQTSDSFLLANDGFFRQNNGCGYVLKTSQGTINEQPSSPKLFSIQIICGSCLPNIKSNYRGSIVDPYVEVSLFGGICIEKNPSESKKQALWSLPETIHHCGTVKTDVVENDAHSPVWESRKCFFFTNVPHVAVLLFTVKDAKVTSKDQFIACSAIPVGCLRGGIRSVQLFNANNSRSGPHDFASLLVHIVHR